MSGSYSNLAFKSFDALQEWMDDGSLQAMRVMCKSLMHVFFSNSCAKGPDVNCVQLDVRDYHKSSLSNSIPASEGIMVLGGNFPANIFNMINWIILHDDIVSHDP